MDLMNLESRYCTLCGPLPQKFVKYPANFDIHDFNNRVFSARRPPDRRHFRLMRCARCGIIFSDPSCSTEELTILYGDSKVTYATDELRIYKSYKPVLERACQLTRHRNCFVEIGGGSGFMLEFAEAKFDALIEVEPSKDAKARFIAKRAAKTAGARFICDVFEKGMLPDSSASLICFFQVLDHISDPREFLNALFDVLEPGGAVACVTHNTNAITARLLGEMSPIFDIEHTYLFNPDNLAMLFADIGFEKIEKFPIANSYALQYWLKLMPLPAVLRGFASRLLNTLRIKNLELSVYAGNFAVICRKPE